MKNKQKIADFGLATQLNIPDEKHFTMCGTPNFISPEIASRNAHGLEADVWSLGCMMYTFLTGKPPFDTDGIRNTLNRVVNAEYEMPAYISNEAQSLIASLLKKNPLERMPLTKVLEHPFMTKRQPSPLTTHHHLMNAGGSSNSGVTTGHSSGFSSSSFKPTSNNASGAGVVGASGSFNESIDSGRGTMTTTSHRSSSANNTTVSSVKTPAHLVTLQSGQEQDFNRAHSRNNLANTAAAAAAAAVSSSSSNVNHHHHHHHHHIANSTSLSSSSSSHSSSTSSSSSSNSSSSFSSKPTANGEQPGKMDAELSAAEATKNLYYNRFINKQSLVNTPPSPPVKLSSYSPTKDKPAAHLITSTAAYQQYQLASASSSSLSSNRMLYVNQTQAASATLSRSNHQLAAGFGAYNPVESNKTLGSAVSMENVNSSLDYLPAAVPSPYPTLPQSQSQQLIYYQSANHNNNSNNLQRSDSISHLSSLNEKQPQQQKRKESVSSVKSVDGKNSTTGCIQEAVSPLKSGSTLLRPTRQASKNAVLNIMEGNEVVLELIKVKKNQQFIMEVIRIDAEQDTITIYQPNNGKGCPIANRPPSPPIDRDQFFQFSYKNLPPNYWKKYDLASK